LVGGKRDLRRFAMGEPDRAAVMIRRWRYLRGRWRLWWGRCPECNDRHHNEPIRWPKATTLCGTCYDGLVPQERRWERFLWALGRRKGVTNGE